MPFTEHDPDLPDEAAVSTDDAGYDEGVDGDVAYQDAVDAGVASEPGTQSLRDLVLYLVSNLVDDPDAVDVDVERRGGSVELRLRVPEAELGRVIGRQGRIARAIRTALMVAASRHHLRVSLDIEPA